MKIAIVEGMKPRYTPNNLKELLHQQFKVVDVEAHPDKIIVLGGDGTMVYAIKKYHHLNIPFYGINQGTYGFLLNEHSNIEKLSERLLYTRTAQFPLLEAKITTYDSDQIYTALAFNDVWTKCFSKEGQGSKLRIFLNGHNITKNDKNDYLSGDGIIICTPGGSTAYNKSAHGLIINQGSHLLGLTPNNPSFPSMNPQYVKDSSILEVEVVESEKRPTTVFADNERFENFKKVTVQKSVYTVNLEFREDMPYDQKLIQLQFPESYK